MTKTNKNQIKPKQNKPQLKAKQPVKTMKQKNLCQKKKKKKKKKGMLTKINGLALFVKGAWKESKIDWIVSRICAISGYKDFILGT